MAKAGWLFASNSSSWSSPITTTTSGCACAIASPRRSSACWQARSLRCSSGIAMSSAKRGPRSSSSCGYVSLRPAGIASFVLLKSMLARCDHCSAVRFSIGVCEVPMPRTILAIGLLFVLAEARVQARAIALEDIALVVVGEERDAFDHRLEVVVVAAGLRVAAAAGAGLLGAEQHAVGADRLEQQLQRVLVVVAGVEVQALQALVEDAQQRLAHGDRTQAAHLVGDCAAA